MRFIHLSDLHLGKRVNEFPMLEDQKYILTKIINIIDEEKPDGIFIAGDVYDKSAPTEEAVKLLDDFLTKLVARKLQVFMISGNHDSAVKLAFANKIMDINGIHISPVYDGNVEPFVFQNGQKKVCIYMLPFVKPIHVRSIFSDQAEEITNYSDACKVAIEHMDIDDNACNILLAHQFVTGAEQSDSEEKSVGGLDNVDVAVFDPFDYVALGHIHGPQRIGRDTVRYCGTPLKYSFSEAKHHKSVTIVEVDEQNQVGIRTVELEPLHDMREIENSFEQLLSKPNYEGTKVDDYLHIILTDENEVLNAMGKLRVIYPNIMKITYSNRRTRENRSLNDKVADVKKQPIELFEELFEMQNNQAMSEEQRSFMVEQIEKIWGEN